MKRISTNVICGLLAFTCGVVAAAFWNWSNYPVKNEEPDVKTLKPPATEVDPAGSTGISPPTHIREVVFGGGRLRIVPEDVQLKSERLRYEINVSYPQIIGSDDPHIRKLNQHIKRFAIEQFQWPLNPSKADLRYYREKHPEAFNSISLDYDVRLATDYLLSIYFIAYSYGIGAAHSVQYSFVINYDLVLRKELKLSDLFTRQSRYLQFISRYCKDELSKVSEFMFERALVPAAENFESWNLTRDGVRFNFDACKIFGCSGGEQAVDIPFTTLEPLLNKTRR